MWLCPYCRLQEVIMTDLNVPRPVPVIAPRLHWQEVVPGIYMTGYPHQYVVAIDIQWSRRSSWYVSRWGRVLGTYSGEMEAKQAAEDHLVKRLRMNA